MSTVAGAIGRHAASPARLLHLQAAVREVDAFYHQLCPSCAALNRARRDARTDLTGRRALLTGGRAKIGMYIALRLLRDGAHTTITTRFPHDAVRRFTAMPDSGDWLHRLRSSASTCATRPRSRAGRRGGRAGPAGHPDQQRRPDRPALARRLRPAGRGRVRAAAGRPLPEWSTFDHTSDAHPAALAGSLAEHRCRT